MVILTFQCMGAQQLAFWYGGEGEGEGSSARLPVPDLLMPPVPKLAGSCCMRKRQAAGCCLHWAGLPWCSVLFTVDAWQIFVELTWYTGVTGRKRIAADRWALTALHVLCFLKSPTSLDKMPSVFYMEATLICMSLGETLKPRWNVVFPRIGYL